MKKLLNKLIHAIGVSGEEDAVFNIINDEVKSYSNEIIYTHNKSVIVNIGNINSDNTILFDAHIDQIGMVVTSIDENGFIKVQVGDSSGAGQSGYCDNMIGNYIEYNEEDSKIIMDRMHNILNDAFENEYINTQDYSKSVDGMKIIPLQTSGLITVIMLGLHYNELYRNLEYIANVEV